MSIIILTNRRTGHKTPHRPTPHGHKKAGTAYRPTPQNGREDTTMKTTKTNAKTNTPNTFTALLTTLATETDHPTTPDAYTKALTDLATAVAYSVLKKCIDVSQNKALIQVRQSIAHDRNTLDRIAYANEHAYTTAYNADGERVQKVNDPDSAKALTALCAECFGDGLDLVNDAVVTILTECKKQRDREPNAPTDLERPYTVRRLNRKVWIKTADSVNGWETVETTPIQEVYKAVRRSVENNASIKINRNGYTYLDEIATDPETDTDTVIYRRFGKYADIGGYATDANGKETFYTADPETVKDIDKLIVSLNLTAKQAAVLSLRQQGHGNKAIATYLGVSHQAIDKTLKQIQVKAIAIGLTPIK